jgi:hypothetical protein
MSITLLLASSAYLIPVLIATGATDIPQSEWKAGTFAVAGTEIGGQWLGNWVVVSTAVSVIGSFCAELAAGEFCPHFTFFKSITHATALSYYHSLPLFIDSMQLMGMSDRGQIPSIFSHRSTYDTPTYSIILCVIVIASVSDFCFPICIFQL